MVKRIVKTTQSHDHWFAEWWSGVLLIIVGGYGFYIQHPPQLNPAEIKDSLHLLSFETWKFIFLGSGLFQLCVLYCGWMLGRGIAAFTSASILLWVFLNIVLYDYWHISYIALGCFVAINIWSLKRILGGIVKDYVGTHKMVVGDKP